MTLNLCENLTFVESVQQDEKFGLSMQKYKGQQYSQLYFYRLLITRQILAKLVKERWPSLPGTYTSRSLTIVVHLILC